MLDGAEHLVVAGDGFIQETSGAWAGSPVGSVPPPLAAVIAAGRSAMNEARGRLKIAVQDKGIEVRAVGPHDGPEFVVHANLRKEVGVGKRLEHGAVQLSCEIDVTRAAIAEADP
jgi:hypothetical protein